LRNACASITGKADADRKELLKEAFNPTTGTLHDKDAWQSERIGIYNFIDGAFLAFRNPPAHKFVETDAEEAFDLIVLANRMLLIIERGQRQSRTQPATPDISFDKLTSLLDAYLSVSENAAYGPKPVFLDADNDGEIELLIPGGSLTDNREHGETFKALRITEESNQQIEVEQGDYSFPAHDILLADVDNDGSQEVVCTTRVGVGYNNILLVHKYRTNRFEVLKKDPEAAVGNQEGFVFFNARVGDVNDDGQVEVVSEPKLSGAAPPPVRYVWKWSQEEGVFKFLYEERLTYDFYP
jgi:hypothetical protein